MDKIDKIGSQANSVFFIIDKVKYTINPLRLVLYQNGSNLMVKINKYGEHSEHWFSITEDQVKQIQTAISRAMTRWKPTQIDRASDKLWIGMHKKLDEVVGPWYDEKS